MTMSVTIDGRNTLESSDAYCALAKTIRLRVDGSFSVDRLVEACSGILRRKRYQLTPIIAPTTGAIHATKIPSAAVMTIVTGSRASFTALTAIFSTATHRDARSPMRTES